MYRTHTCGKLNVSNAGEEVTLAGWVHKSRDLGGMTFIDLRDRYGKTQLVFNMESGPDLCRKARELGREFVISVTGRVAERSNKNLSMTTGEIEIIVEKFEILNRSDLPPFTIEDDTDGGDELRMKYRYLDLRREPVRNNLIHRHKMAQEVRKYLDGQGFIEVETPVLIKSTPEGARDFVVPSRLHNGEFYALPQSPQTFKQLLMISGLDRYFQIVKCFRDEDLRADRQPEFTQIDCEISFVEQEDVINTFEGLAKHLFRVIRDIEYSEPFPRIPYSDALEYYGTDKPDLRFGMKICRLTKTVKGKGFPPFDNAEYTGAIAVPGAATMTRKEVDQLTEWVKRPQIGAGGLVYLRCNEEGSLKSSVGKFFSDEDMKQWVEQTGAVSGDMIFLMAGERSRTLNALGELRLEMGERLGLRKPGEFAPLWVVDFPLLEWDEESKRFYAMHHPFTSPKKEDVSLMTTDPGSVKADAYDLVINGVEIGGGSIRIHDRELQRTMFTTLGFTPDEAEKQFGFLLNAFRYGAPPHGGVAFGFDRWVSLFAGSETIRDFIAFPKNNSARDIMIETPSVISAEQLKELGLILVSSHSEDEKYDD